MSNAMKDNERNDGRGGRWTQVAGAVAALAFLVAAPAGAALAQTHGTNGADGADGANRADRAMRLALAPESELLLEGTSTVHDWSCEAGEIDAEMRVRLRDSMPDDAALPDAIDRVTIEIPVDRIACGDDTMDEKLREALRAERHPRVTFRMDDYAILPEDEPGEAFVGAQGTLTIAGETRPIQLNMIAREADDGSLRISGTGQLLMSDFDIERPTAMFGLLKTHDRVVIRFDLVAGYEQIAAGLEAGGWNVVDHRTRP